MTSGRRYSVVKMRDDQQDSISIYLKAGKREGEFVVFLTQILAAFILERVGKER